GAHGDRGLHHHGPADRDHRDPAASPAQAPRGSGAGRRGRRWRVELLMRAPWLVALAACTPEIATDAFLCGPEQACPPGFVCNGDDNRCVTPSNAEPFGCGGLDALEPDNDLAHAVPVGALACISPLQTIDGCLAAGDAADWFAFDAPASCTS